MSHGYLILLVDSLQVIIGGKLHQTLVLPGLNKGKQVQAINTVFFEWAFSPWNPTPPLSRGTWHCSVVEPELERQFFALPEPEP
jgi:hypothetical protein